MRADRMPNKKIQEIKGLMKLALPLVLIFISQKGTHLVDIIMMGKIGTQALAVGALAVSSFMTVFVFCTGSLSAVGVFISRALGAREDHAIVGHLKDAIHLGVLLCVPAMFLVWYSPLLLKLAGEEMGIVHGAELFLHGLVWGFPGLIGFFILRELVSAFAMTKVTLWISLLSIPATAVANDIFIYGQWGIPPLGIAGIGYAGAIIQWLMFFSLLGYCLRHSRLQCFLKKLSFYGIRWRQIGILFYFGAPSGCLYVLDVGMVFMAALMMGHFGSDALAAHQIALMCVSISYAIPFGFSMTAALRVGHAVGANDLARAKIAGWFAIGLGFIISVFIAMLFLLGADFLIPPFLDDRAVHNPNIRHLAAVLLGIAGLFQCFDAVQAITAGALRGLKDTWMPMLMTTLCFWILGVGSAYLFAFHTHLGASGIWYGLTLGICSAGLLLPWRLLWRYRCEERACKGLSS